MPAFSIVIDSTDPLRDSSVGDPNHLRASTPRIVDVIVDRSRITAKIGRQHAGALLRDLAYATAELASGKRFRTSVQFYNKQDAWTLGLERVQEEVRLTLFQGGTNVQVALYDRPVKGKTLVQAITAAIDSTVNQPDIAHPLSSQIVETNGSPKPFADLQVARKFLLDHPWKPSAKKSNSICIKIAPKPTASISFSTTFPFRIHPSEPAQPDVERNDLHSLLTRGTIDVQVGNSVRKLGVHYPFLIAESLIEESQKLVLAWDSGTAWRHRKTVIDLTIGLRVTSSAHVDLSFGVKTADNSVNTITFPSIRVEPLVKSIVVFCRAIIQALTHYDPNQHANLRVVHLQKRVEAVALAVEQAHRNDTRLNPSPETYQAFAASQTSIRSETDEMSWGKGKVHFHLSWQAIIPGIDLNAIFLIQHRFVAAGNRELAAIDCAAGQLMWRASIGRGITLNAPGGLVRLAPDGNITFHDLETGIITMNSRVVPRSSGLPAGAVVNDPALPKLVVLSEGQCHLTAVDYVTGEIRWRHALEQSSAFKVRRAGKLFVICCSTPNLCAIDVTTGELVWKIRDPAKFCKPVSYRDGELFVVSGDNSVQRHRNQQLYAIDPWTGETKWTRPLGFDQNILGPPLIHPSVVVLELADQRGRGFSAFQKSDGSPKWSIPPGFIPNASAWTATNNMLIINGANGLIAGINLEDGNVLWRQIVACPQQADAPRRLDPVVRSGLIFAPQHNTIVLHPSDGTLLGEVQADLVPDTIRVSDNCSVVVVEESGHVAAFRTGARLCLVKS